METLTPETTEQKFVRRPRAAENRESETREASKRTPITFARGSRFNLSESMLNDPKYEYSFVEYSVNKEEDYSRCDNVLGNHWKPVHQGDHPDLERYYGGTFKKEKGGDTVIRTGGQVLFRRERDICDAEREEFAAQNKTSDDLVAAHRAENPMGHYFKNNISAASQLGGRL